MVTRNIGYVTGHTQQKEEKNEIVIHKNKRFLATYFVLPEKRGKRIRRDITIRVYNYYDCIGAFSTFCYL